MRKTRANVPADDKPPAHVAFGAAIRHHRKARGMTQTQFGDLIGMKQSYVGAIERGEKSAELKTILRICRGLDVAPSTLFTTAEERGLR